MIYNENLATTLPTFYNYKTPRIVKTKTGWYIEYSYRIPHDIRHLYNNKKWHRFRFREDINKRKGYERTQYADWFCNEIHNSLKRGYNPFSSEVEFFDSESKGVELPEELVARDAFVLFLEKWDQRGLPKETIAKYRRYVGRLMEWLDRKMMLFNDVNNIKSDHIEVFLHDCKKKYAYGNREYNNTYDFIRTAFNYLLKKKLINVSPMVGIDKLKSKSSKHRFFDDATLKKITSALLLTDPYSYLAFQTVYYLCVRSEKELKSLKVGNIHWQQNMIMAEAEGTKGGSARYIPMDVNIKKLFIEKKIDTYPADYYIFGIHGKPAPKPFGHGFFSKRFKTIRELAGLPDWFTLYGAKHTRIIHLKQDGLQDADIMALTGHKDFVAYAKYLRDLGLTANPDKINLISRKI